MTGCSICGGTGYKPAAVYGVGTGSGPTSPAIWADHAVMEPCECRRWKWSPVPPHWPQAVIVPLEGH